MEELFYQVLNMSITGGYVILAVLLIRLLLYKAPKKYAYSLWSVVGFRLICPYSFESLFSLFSLHIFDMTKAQAESGTLTYVAPDIGYAAQPQVTVGISAANTLINRSLPEATPYASVNPIQVWSFLASVIWSVGIAAMVIFGLVSFLRIRRKVCAAIRLEGNVWQSDAVRSPFILGVVCPKIYIPFHLDSQTQHYVLAHERHHLRRFDHLVKFVSYCLLALHWFNPLCWLAFFLMSRDMEISCDEAVLRTKQTEGTAYSMSLLSIAANRRFPAFGLLAFGETDVKKRIVHILKWKRPKAFVTVAAFILSICVLIGCAANPVRKKTYDYSGATYVSDEVLYMNPFSSYYAADGTGDFYCSLNLDSIQVRTWYDVSWEYEMGQWQDCPYTHSQWEDLFMLSSKAFTLKSDSKWLQISQDHYMVQQDGQMYLVEIREINKMGDQVWSIYHMCTENISAFASREELIQSALEKELAMYGGYHTVSYVILGGEGIIMAGEEPEKLTTGELACEETSWMLVLSQEFSQENGVLKAGRGIYTPVVATTREYYDAGFELSEFYQNSGVSRIDWYQATGETVSEAVTNEQRNISLKQSAYAQAIDDLDIDTDFAVKTLLDTICSSPAQYSFPGAYIAKHSAEFNELIYYGDHTLQHCFQAFQEGDTGGIRGRIMVLVCQKIMESYGESFQYAYMTADEWFAQYQQTAQKLIEEYTPQELERLYPSVYILWKCLS